MMPMVRETATKVVLLIDSLVSGGAQRQIVVLANELYRRGYCVTVLRYYPRDELSHFVDPGVKLVHVPRHSRFDLAYAFRLRRFLIQEKPYCLISYLTTPNFWARVVGRLARVPRIITSERSLALGHRPSQVLIERALAQLSDRIVVNAWEIQSKLVALGIKSDRIEVIYNGVDPSVFRRQADADIGRLREGLGIKSAEKLVLLPGRITKAKNHLLLIDAIVGLQEQARGVKVVFAGNEHDEEIRAKMRYTIAAAGLEGQFVFLGQRNDMPLLYSAADAVVLPSLWEGFPNAVIEAMACGTPVIVSDVSDNCVIVENGATGLTFPSGDAIALAKALRYILMLSPEDRRAMGSRAAARAASLCSLAEFGERYVSLIQRPARETT
jgi:glycosyltransferase involved in cell wall biosynthesis